MNGVSESSRGVPPKGWVKLGAAATIPWLIANFVGLATGTGKASTESLILTAQWSLTASLLLAFVLSRVRSTSEWSWSVAALGGLINGVMLGLAFLEGADWPALIASSVVLGILGSAGAGALWYAGLNLGKRDRNPGDRSGT